MHYYLLTMCPVSGVTYVTGLYRKTLDSSLRWSDVGDWPGGPGSGFASFGGFVPAALGLMQACGESGSIKVWRLIWWIWLPFPVGEGWGEGVVWKTLDSSLRWSDVGDWAGGPGLGFAAFGEFTPATLWLMQGCNVNIIVT